MLKPRLDQILNAKCDEARGRGHFRVHLLLIISLHFHSGPRLQSRFCKLENAANPTMTIFSTYGIDDMVSEFPSATQTWTGVSTDVTYLNVDCSIPCGPFPLHL
jgi:hypothetical protein